MATKEREDYKFRISCKMTAQAKPKATEFEFHYPSLTLARKNYKAILLGLYRNRGLTGFSICLNRTRDRKWAHPIFVEQVQ
jgi:hypothetical protein